VALAYEPGERAPRVVATGSRELAEAIIARAREAGVYVHESPELVAMLMQVDLDEHIPEALYLVVAELLAWIWRIEQRGAPVGRAPAALTAAALAPAALAPIREPVRAPVHDPAGRARRSGP
jgi:flagellar biosynthesis protein